MFKNSNNSELIDGSLPIPGPGDYEAKGTIGGGVKYITRKIRGKTVRMHSEMPYSAVFKSSTGRSLD